MHWDHMKLIKDDIDVSFMKNDDDVTNKPASLQVSHDGLKSGPGSVVYSLRNRSVHAK